MRLDLEMIKRGIKKEDLEDLMRVENPGQAIFLFDWQDNEDGSSEMTGYQSIDRDQLLVKCGDKFSDSAIQKMVDELQMPEAALRNMTFLAYIKAAPHWGKHLEALKKVGVE